MESGNRDPYYYYVEEAEQFQFFKFPKALITEPVFSELSMSSRVLYGLMQDRMALSKKNNWIDEKGRIFIIYTVEQIKADLHISNTPAVKILKELEDIGLIEKVRRGQGMPSVIYVRNFITIVSDQEQNGRILKSRIQEFQKVEFKNSKKWNSRIPKSGVQEFQNIESINTDNKDTNKNRLIVHIGQNKTSLLTDAYDYETIIDIWNKTEGVVKIKSIEPGSEREKKLNDRLARYGLDTFADTVSKIPGSDYLKQMKVKFNWFLKPDNFVNVMEGAYEGNKVPSNKKNNIHNFDERAYDYDDIERKMMKQILEG